MKKKKEHGKAPPFIQIAVAVDSDDTDVLYGLTHEGDVWWYRHGWDREHPAGWFRLDSRAFSDDELGP
jgi:hypothetical protein